MPFAALRYGRRFTRRTPIRHLPFRPVHCGRKGKFCPCGVLGWGGVPNGRQHYGKEAEPQIVGKERPGVDNNLQIIRCVILV
jgi:hypothetical protein